MNDVKAALAALLKAAGSDRKAVSIETALRSRSVPAAVKQAYRDAVARSGE